MTILQHSIAQAAAAATGYQISRSLRFNSADSAYLNRTPSAAGNRTKWAYSKWIKIGSLSTSSDNTFFSAGATDGAVMRIEAATMKMRLYDYNGTSFAFNLITTQVFRDPGAHVHVYFAYDSTQATASERARLYLNGVRVTAFDTAAYPTLNQQTAHFNNNVAHNIGRASYSSANYFDGYFSDARFLDGFAPEPTDLGEFDANTGVWVPKAYTGTYGTNGFWLKFDDNSGVTATTLGKDSSGNGNNWTPNNFSVTAGVGNDSLVDSPTNYGTDTGAGGEVRGNYCTFNALQNGGLTLANGNLDASATSAAWRSVTGTLAQRTGKFYFEVTVTATTATNYMIVGVGRSSMPQSAVNSEPGATADGWGIQFGSPAYKLNNGYTSLGTNLSYVANDVLMVAVDVDAGKFWFGKNGTWILSGDPATGANAIFTNLTGEILPMVGVYASGNTGSANFGQRPFAYTAPSGFKALCTTNLPTPAIGASASTLAEKNFNTILYTGNGSTQTITGVGFQPDFSWIKVRSISAQHVLIDAVRGGTKQLFSSSTNAEQTDTNITNGFSSDGFLVGNNTTGTGSTNQTSQTYVAWNWKANGAGVSNTAGSITSTVSANTAAGIAIVGWTGTGANGTIGHGLGKAPSLILIKSRSAGSTNWNSYHAAIGAGSTIVLNLTIASTAGSQFFNNTAPTSSVFSVGTDGSINPSGQTQIAYCFAEVAGFSKFGSYTGNGSADGPFVYCGFRPRWILFKKSSSATNAQSWNIIDAARLGYNAPNYPLYPNASNAEATNNTLDILSNGFKIRVGDVFDNENGQTYIFAAFAEAPFNYARAR